MVGNLGVYGMKVADAWRQGLEQGGGRPAMPNWEEQVAERLRQMPPRYRATYHRANSNLRTQLERILARAGLEPWPRLFQNLRSTRETELASEYPLHVVTYWIGNTARIAAEHYLQIPDEVYEKAAQNAAHEAQKQAQHPPQWGAWDCTRTHRKAPQMPVWPVSARKQGPRRMSLWRRGDSNPRPEMFQDKHLRA
jgi:hypothetical protein